MAGESRFRVCKWLLWGRNVAGDSLVFEVSLGFEGDVLVDVDVADAKGKTVIDFLLEDDFETCFFGKFPVTSKISDSTRCGDIILDLVSEIMRESIEIAYTEEITDEL